MNVADHLVAFLGKLGVRYVFGYPGSPLVPLLMIPTKGGS